MGAVMTLLQERRAVQTGVTYLEEGEDAKVSLKYEVPWQEVRLCLPATFASMACTRVSICLYAWS
jgi:translation elongation factor EF-4